MNAPLPHSLIAKLTPFLPRNFLEGLNSSAAPLAKNTHIPLKCKWQNRPKLFILGEQNMSYLQCVFVIFLSWDLRSVSHCPQMTHSQTLTSKEHAHLLIWNLLVGCIYVLISYIRLGGQWHISVIWQMQNMTWNCADKIIAFSFSWTWTMCSTNHLTLQLPQLSLSILF